MEVNNKPKKRRKRQKRLPEGAERVVISVRVAPETKAYLEELGMVNLGRAIDQVVAVMRLTGMNPRITVI